MEVDKSKVLTDHDIDILLEDWFDRDGETFIKATSKDRLEWEKGVAEGEAYSSYFLESPTKFELIRRAYSLARDMIVVMNPPMRVRVKVSTANGSYTDGKFVHISTRMFDDKDLSTGEQLDTFLGTTVHEGSHLLYTDFHALRTLGDLPRTVQKIITLLNNIIEDERIEMQLGQEKPGLTRFLEKSKYYYFDQFYLDYVLVEEAKRTLTDFEKLMGVFLRIVRYPKYLKEEDFVFFGHHLFAVKAALFPYPQTTLQSIECAKKIFEIFKEFYKEKMEEEKREDREKREREEGGSGDGDGEDGEDKPKPDDTPSKEEVLKKLLADTGGSVEKALEKLLGSMETTGPDSKEGMPAGKVSPAISGIVGELIEGTVELGASKDTIFTKAVGNDSEYLDSLSRVRKYIPAISQTLKGHCREYKLIHRSMRSGVLDTNKLAEAVQGVPTVYIREGEVVTDRVCVGVLIDESGSMGGSKIKSARDTAVLINEAVGCIAQVDVFIYGHTGDIRYSGATELNVYRERGFSPKYALGSVEAHCQNRDGVAIYETAKRIRKFTQDPVLLFVLSDGAPCADRYGGSSAMENVRETVNKVTKMGFQVVQVCIEHSYDPAKMFKHYVILEDMSRLAVELGKVIKKATINAAKVHVK